MPTLRMRKLRLGEVRDLPGGRVALCVFFLMDLSWSEWFRHTYVTRSRPPARSSLSRVLTSCLQCLGGVRKCYSSVQRALSC